MSTEPYLLFGRLCVRANYFSSEELRKVISLQFREQKKGNSMLFGDVCIELGLINAEQRDKILELQKADEIMPEATVFGYLGVINGFVSKGKIDETLRIQKGLLEKNTKKKIGEIMLDMKLLVPIQIQAILKAQNRLRKGLRSTDFLSRGIKNENSSAPTDKSGNALKQNEGWTKDKLLLAGTVSNVIDEVKTVRSPKKPTMEEIQQKLKKLEEDFGGEFEISIDEDDVAEVDIDMLSDSNPDFTPTDITDTNVLKKIVAEEEIKKTSALFRANLMKNQNTPEFREKTQIPFNLSGNASKAPKPPKQPSLDIDKLNDTNDFEKFIANHDTDYIATQIVVESPTDESTMHGNIINNLDDPIIEAVTRSNPKIKNGKTKKVSKAPKVKRETDVVLDNIDLKPVEEIEYKGVQEKSINVRKSRVITKAGKNQFRGRLQMGQIDIEYKKEYPVKKVLVIVLVIISIFLVYLLSSILFNS